MEEDSSIEQLFTKLRSYEWIIPKIVQQAREEGGDLNIDDGGFLFGIDLDYRAYELLKAEVSDDVFRIREENLERKISAVGFEYVDHWAVANETEVVEKLRKCCDAFGKEKHKTLNESAGYLLELGKIYMKYALATKGIQQKLNFIKSSALIVAGKLRFEKLKMTKGQQYADSELRKLHENIINTPRLKGVKNVLIFENSQKVKIMLEKYRREVGAKLDKIVPIRTGGNEKCKLEKITQIKEICKLSTEYYLHIMATVAEMCRSIMGEPPCQFSIFGLGSLARQEVTLYSDFEHAIVLEDPGPGTEIDLDTRDYFRWFTTIFHITIVGLGETVVPSVNVKSLCDFFSDEYTPCGMSFDGMMPHACKIPLGRTESTHLRKHIVELIQPVKSMVNFLTKDEEIKNGYFLSDVLSRCCYVYGCQEVYDDFYRQSRLVILQTSIKDVALQQVKYIMLNPNEIVQNPLQFSLLHNRNVKASIYRPLTTLLSCIATLCGITTRSSFEIVDGMKESSVVNEDWYDKLIYAVAVTMEARMKTYQMTGHQRKNLTNLDVANLVGEASAFDCYLSLCRLTRATKSLMYRSWKESASFHSLTPPVARDIHLQIDETAVLTSFRKAKEAIELGLTVACKTLEEFITSKILAPEAHLVLMTTINNLIACLTELNLGSMNKTVGEWFGDPEDVVYPASLHLKQAEYVCGILHLLADNKDDILKLAHYCMSHIYFFQNRYQQALEEYERWQVIDEKSPQVWAEGMEQAAFFSMVIMTMRKAMEPGKMLNHINHMLADENQFGIQCVLITGKCHALLQLGSKKKAKETLYTLTKEVHSNAKLLGKTQYQLVLSMIHVIQKQGNFTFDLLFTTQLLSETTAVDFTENVKVVTPVLRESVTEVIDIMSNCMNPSVFTKSISKSTNPRVLKIRDLVSLGTVLKKVHSASSYAELIASISSIIDGFGKIQFRFSLPVTVKTGLFLNHVGCFMTLFEKVRLQQVEFVANKIRSAPGKLRAYKALQPFMYACFADFLPNGSSFQRSAGVMLLQKVASEQHRIFKALYGVLTTGRYEKALLLYIDFRFESCAAVLWKLLHMNETSRSIRSKSTELFVTTVLTIMIIQKRQRPPRYFEKTREISLCQSLNLFISTTGQIQSFWIQNQIIYRRFLYCSDPLVPVYNLAIEQSSVNHEKAVCLLWKILHSPNVTNRIRCASITQLTQVLHFNLSLRHNTFDTFQNMAGDDNMSSRNRNELSSFIQQMRF